MKDYRQIIAHPEIFGNGQSVDVTDRRAVVSFQPDLFHMARLSGQSTVAKE